MTSNASTIPLEKHLSMSDIHIVREYPHPRHKVWRALTDPDLIRRWLMRPEGFAPVVGNHFKLLAKAQPGWRGFVECEVLEVRENERLRYSWVGNDGQSPMEVTFVLEEVPSGTRLTFLHTGFTGFGGFLLAKLMLGPGWGKMFRKLMPNVLDHLADDGTLEPNSDVPYKF
jgi:uncharacterized protein YndB with AHSA1/START domain